MSLSHEEIISEALLRIQSAYEIDADEFWEMVKQIAEDNLEDEMDIEEIDDEF
jgi:hypothetical protein